MKVLGFRFCTVSPEAPHLAAFFDAVGFERHPLEGGASSADAFTGAVFAAGESWIAMWPPGGDMPSGVMLQVVVDDADAFAARAREHGLEPAGPTDSQGKRLYFLQAPTGLQISIQSRMPEQGRHAAEPTKSLPAPPPPPARGRPQAAAPVARPQAAAAAARTPGGVVPPPRAPRTPGQSAAPPPLPTTARVAPSAGAPPRASAAPIAPPRGGAFRRAPRS